MGLSPSRVSGMREGRRGVLKDPQCGGVVGGWGTLPEEFAMMLGKENLRPGK